MPQKEMIKLYEIFFTALVIINCSYIDDDDDDDDDFKLLLY